MSRPLPNALLPASPTLAYFDRRRRRFGMVFLVAAGGCYVFALAVIAAGMPWQMPIGTLVGGTLFLLLRHWALAARDERRLELAVHAMAAIGIAVLYWYVWFNGSQLAYSLWFLGLIPIAVVVLGNLRIMLFWMLVSLAAVLLTHALGDPGMAPAAAIIPVTPTLYLIAQSIFVVVAGLYAAAVVFTNEEYVEEMRTINQQLLAQKQQLDLQADALAHSLAEAERAQAEAEAARRAADAANRAKSDFLAVMSHEIRTPLNGVVGLNSLLLSLPLDDKAREYAELGRQSGETLLSLVNGFLDFSKIEAGHVELSPVPFPPRQVIADALATVREAAAAKSLQLNVEATLPPALRGDPARLRQILVNLLGNAVKFTPSGAVTLRAQARAEASGRHWLDIEVVDTGIGIDDATRARLFQPFAQADASTTRRYGGTGLGLAICKALAELMGGTIGVSSTPGRGSTFRVSLPFAPAAADSLEPATAPAAAGAPAGAGNPRDARGRVLVAEDNQVNQVVAVEMLRRLGYAVDVVANGRAAIDAALAGDYDLVLMDCEMPEVDGFAACRTIRARETGSRHLPVVAMTASALSGDRERCLAAGMDDYLPKPVRLRDIERVTAQWVQRRPA